MNKCVTSVSNKKMLSSMSKVLPRVILYYVEVGARFCWGVHFGYVIDAYYRL